MKEVLRFTAGTLAVAILHNGLHDGHEVHFEQDGADFVMNEALTLVQALSMAAIHMAGFGADIAWEIQK
jgi:hypothetical protein